MRARKVAPVSQRADHGEGGEYAAVETWWRRVAWKSFHRWVYVFLAGFLAGALVIGWLVERRLEPRLASMATKVLAIEAARMECETELEEARRRCAGSMTTDRRRRW